RTRRGHYLVDAQRDATNDPNCDPEPLLDGNSGRLRLWRYIHDSGVKVSTVTANRRMWGIRGSTVIAEQGLVRGVSRTHRGWAHSTPAAAEGPEPRLVVVNRRYHSLTPATAVWQVNE